MQTDLDGRQTYSSVMSVSLENKLSAIAIYPNPATDNVMIVFPSAGSYEVTLLNSNGQIMKNPVLINGNKLALNVSALKAGIYFIHINHDDTSETKK